ncbi:carotenoid biosynthesis protein [Acidovorax lacteus]|uniref:Carotenoid biosynthesis protein n=1 Tax=Acidovorax lacteus TaxID=1924988 RepID=A0ABP8L653_9BURK
MRPHPSRLPLLMFLPLAVAMLATAWQSHNPVTLAIVAASLLMFAACWASASQVLGHGPALRFVAVACGLGWLAEQLGSTLGWFFGDYTYTPLLGLRLGDVPLVIPMMWFALTYAGFIMANLIVWQRPVTMAGSHGLPGLLFLALLGGMIVTAFDLGADPYLVFHLHAWDMLKKGSWFGETMQGFVGWVFVSFVILSVFRWNQRSRPEVAAPHPLMVLLPMGIYASGMVFQMIWGVPVETRAIAPFAMGIPLLCALAGFWRWRHDSSEGL